MAYFGKNISKRDNLYIIKNNYFLLGGFLRFTL